MSSSNEEILVSSDSHVTELPSVWDGLLGIDFFEGAPGLTNSRGVDPTLRGKEMQMDGVVAEVLYPTLGLRVFAIEDVELQEACCRAYNRWLIEYCKADPQRLLGLAMIPCYRADVAIEEMRFCHAAGLRGALIWRTPHPDLPFTSLHYDPIWKVAEELDWPINVHILSGFDYASKEGYFRGRGGNVEGSPEEMRLRNINHYRDAVNTKLWCTADTLFTFIFSGILERFPALKLVIVENEASWLPFFIDQWDYYCRRSIFDLEITKPPSEYFDEQVFVTFFRDPWVGRILPTFGQNSFMWSNDFPHNNSTWPKSREVVAEQIAGVDKAIQDKVLRQNCLDLYKIPAELVAQGLSL